VLATLTTYNRAGVEMEREDGARQEGVMALSVLALEGHHLASLNLDSDGPVKLPSEGMSRRLYSMRESERQGGHSWGNRERIMALVCGAGFLANQAAKWQPPENTTIYTAVEWQDPTLF
jgi:hypothetical protein